MVFEQPVFLGQFLGEFFQGHLRFDQFAVHLLVGEVEQAQAEICLLENLRHRADRVEGDAEGLGRLLDHLVELLEDAIDFGGFETQQLLRLGAELLVVQFRRG